MKSKEEFKKLSEMNHEDLVKKLGEVEHELMSLRFRHASAQLNQTSQLRNLRKTIARIKTIQRQAELRDEAKG